ncbi:hypothetical protein MHBO_001017 [Bonamia ostreae]|uniref:Peptidase S1 domain-containing protein n=1 Tax=Bonamia ostreae TaxID=126728 RepID=A0ABV2AHL0_9EUKA
MKIIILLFSFYLCKPQKRSIDRIIDGTDVPPGKYPFVVMANGCGASLIAPNYILTAAHCESEVGNSVWIGRTEFSGGRKLNVLQKWKNGSGEGQDILIAKISPTVNDFKPILIDSGKNGFSDPNKENTVIGWGDTTPDSQYVFPKTLQEITAPILSQQDCAAMCENWWPLDTELCLKDVAGKSIAPGDSGSPLFVRSGSDFVQTGVVHGANSCAKYGIFIRVSKFVDWILNTAPGSDVVKGGNSNDSGDSYDGNSDECSFGEEQKNTFLKDFACGNSQNIDSLEMAKQKCCDCRECKGVTKTQNVFSVRKGPSTAYSPIGESSWVKVD